MRRKQVRQRKNKSVNRRKECRRTLAAEPLEVRQCLTASLGWDGPGQGSADLSYYIGNAPSGVSQQAFESAIETALDAWSEVVDIEFTQTDQPNQFDSLDFTSRNIDGNGGTLAQAYFPDDVNSPRIAGDVQFDTADNWEVGNQQGRQAFDLVWVAVHEIGHALGIDHLDHSDSVLAPFVSASQEFVGLSNHDVEAALEIYAPAANSDPSATNVETVPDTQIHDHDHEGDDHDPAEEPTVVPTVPNDVENDFEEDTADTNPNFRPWRRHWRNGNVWFRIGGRMIAVENQHNAVQPTDVNQDGETSAADALAIINFLVNPSDDQSTMLVDVNNDGFASASDVLSVINEVYQRRFGKPHTRYHGRTGSARSRRRRYWCGRQRR